MNRFTLPTTVFILFRMESGRVVAHNLDFDLVCVDESKEMAERKIVEATRGYVEYGLRNGLEECMHRPAPQKFWDQIPDTLFSSNNITIPNENQSVLAISHAIQSGPSPARVAG